MIELSHPTIVFDGLCPLCSTNARFILKHDRSGRFRLAAMQGEVGAALYRRFGIDPADPQSLILVEGDRMRRDSDAVLPPAQIKAHFGEFSYRHGGGGDEFEQDAAWQAT